MATPKKPLQIKKLPKNAKEADNVKGGLLPKGGVLRDRTDDAMSCSTTQKCCS
ncbi:MAG: hypothetical protein ACHQQ3_14335 [Gemmatimonadales bacterium]